MNAFLFQSPKPEENATLFLSNAYFMLLKKRKKQTISMQITPFPGFIKCFFAKSITGLTPFKLHILNIERVTVVQLASIFLKRGREMIQAMALFMLQ